MSNSDADRAAGVSDSNGDAARAVFVTPARDGAYVGMATWPITVGALEVLLKRAGFKRADPPARRGAPMQHIPT